MKMLKEWRRSHLSQLIEAQEEVEFWKGRVDEVDAKLRRPLPAPRRDIVEALASGCEVKKSVASKFLDTLASIATAEVKKTGVFNLPGVLRLKVRTKQPKKAKAKQPIRKKPATKAGKGSGSNMVKATPAARKIVKAFPTIAFKRACA